MSFAKCFNAQGAADSFAALIALEHRVQSAYLHPEIPSWQHNGERYGE